MAEINTEVLSRLVSCKLGTISSSCDINEFLIAVSANTVDPNSKASYYDTVAQIPNLLGAPLPKGTIIFVKQLDIHLVAFAEQWWTLDGRMYRNDGPSRTVWAWGCNNSGQIGDTTTVSKSSPVSVVGGFTDWCQVSAGRRHSAAVRTNGTIWSWGYNGWRAIGDCTGINKSSPVSVVGGFTDWCQVSAGGDHSAAVRTNGTLWAWGNNSVGQLGNNTTVTTSSPVSVVGGFTDWCQVSAGGNHTAAVRTNGTIWTWGLNTYGILGDGTAISRSSPVSVVGGFTDWCHVSAGSSHTAALRTNGTIWTWGNNGNGRLGDNTSANKSSPVSVVGGFTDWCHVSAGGCHSAAVRTNGTIWAWGYGGNGRLGTNSVTNKSSPVSVVGGFTDWCQVSAGVFHTAAVRTNGTVWTWGFNGSGELGDDNIIAKSSPVSVVGGFTDWCQVSAGYRVTLSIRAS